MTQKISVEAWRRSRGDLRARAGRGRATPHGERGGAPPGAVGGGGARAATAGMATTGDASGAPRLYHERQESGFCGAHALNCLLQAPLLDEVALAQVAAELDAREAKLREGPALPAGGGGPSPRVPRSTDTWMVRKLKGADGTANVDAGGNFSVSVLTQALSAFGAELLTPTQADAQTRRAGGAAQSGCVAAARRRAASSAKSRPRGSCLRALRAGPSADAGALAAAAATS